MKRQLLLLALLVFSSITFAQKKELRKADKALADKNYAEALNSLTEAEALLGAADNATKAQFHLIKGEALLGQAGKSNFEKMKMAAAELLKAKELGSKEGDRLQQAEESLKNTLVTSAIDSQNSKDYSGASQKLLEAYNFSTKDTSYLYYAAGNSWNAGDLTTALSYYEKLLDMGFTGIHIEYSATNPEDGAEQVYATMEDRDNMVKFMKYTNPVDRKTESLVPDMLQKITLIYLNQGNTEKASAVIKKARAANPNDVTLIRSEADLAYKMGDIDKYTQLMAEIVKTDPNNPELYFNLGVSSAQLGDMEKAGEYYSKALELKPDYSPALINTALLILHDESKIIEEMNNLGNSRADNLRYDELKEVRKKMYEKALPYLEKAAMVVPDNTDVLHTLVNLYSQMGMDDKYKATKAKLDSLEN
ncbi:MAG TPA: tetratricopeptide repeat protein [Flavobacteriaceae bacterium]|nr:tetratricopeptide repeat protein [Flavobacteriaceae bacterium]MCB9213310.1 tetratricopeptide repeat protein [Alteromonas sp.]HPF10200.1 tetratricopeptide repeat protein [Flavobacteriaceae bacterium]HQU20646.1 tetratricopeptide repeat protein [Flavobacteriaceae bacterium]HQU64936.1 tetratricopeptide repeat protein [Flavobacteriaceae bacterium]